MTSLALALPTAATAAPVSANPVVQPAVVSGVISSSPASFVASEIVKISADFPTSKPKVSLLSDNGSGGALLPVSGQTAKTADSSGKYTFSVRINTAQKVQVQTSVGDTTPVLQLTPQPTTGTLDPITEDGTGHIATARAHFTPIRKGQSATLQILTLVTTTTDEVTTAHWKDIATTTQDANGTATFSLTDPLEVSHQYRAFTGPSGATIHTISNEVVYAAGRTSKNTGLSTIYLNTNQGDSINTRTHYFEGQFSMTGSSAIPECVATGAPQLASAKGRGNYSWSFSKKSFTLKLDKKTDLCGMGKSKKWALIANAYDKSLLRGQAAFNIGSKLTNLAWTPDAKPVDLYINGSYRGSYNLVERITADPNRVNVPELDNSSTNITGGYLLEWDFRKGADHNVTAGSRGWVGIKEPENEDDGTGITTPMVNYINNYLDQADAALFGSNFTSNTSGWQKYIDKNSAVDYYIAQELMKPVDGNMWASTYMYKQADGKLFFGPMWDYDLAAGSADRAGGTVFSTGFYLRNPVNISAKQSTKTWFNRLNEDSEFRSAVASRWHQVYAALKTDDAFLAGQASIISASANENFKKWDVHEHISTSQVVKGSWSAEVSYLRGWLRTRISWMNSQY
ncbi:MAG: CotH protein [Aeromicrobium sp.]|nr:CotH protein [Aeromicrobium sp.]